MEPQSGQGGLCCRYLFSAQPPPPIFCGWVLTSQGGHVMQVSPIKPLHAIPSDWFWDKHVTHCGQSELGWDLHRECWERASLSIQDPQSCKGAPVALRCPCWERPGSRWGLGSGSEPGQEVPQSGGMGSQDQANAEDQPRLSRNTCYLH